MNKIFVGIVRRAKATSIFSSRREKKIPEEIGLLLSRSILGQFLAS